MSARAILRVTIAAGSGLLFGLGLILGGMTSPLKVKAFLDLAGAWDPSLGLVMGGAVAVGLAAFARARRLRLAWSGDDIQIPSSTVIDARLVGGGLLFGAGWGLAGYCPGPAIVALSAGSTSAGWFVVAMAVGMAAFDRLSAPRR